MPIDKEREEIKDRNYNVKQNEIRNDGSQLEVLRIARYAKQKGQLVPNSRDNCNNNIKAGPWQGQNMRTLKPFILSLMLPLRISNSVALAPPDLGLMKWFHKG